MKNFIISTIFIFLSLTLFGQIDYPRYETDSLGQKVIVMTVQQAQTLDNSTDLIPLFNKLNVQLGTVDSACIKVVNDKDVVIAKQQVQINDQKNLINTKNDEISNLQKRIDQYITNEKFYKDEIKNKDAEIQLHLDKIQDQKVKMWVGGSLGGLSIIGLIIGIIAIK
jgi:hypothetical protein